MEEVPYVVIIALLEGLRTIKVVTNRYLFVISIGFIKSELYGDICLSALDFSAK